MSSIVLTTIPYALSVYIIDFPARDDMRVSISVVGQFAAVDTSERDVTEGMAACVWLQVCGDHKVASAVAKSAKGMHPPWM